MEKKKQDLKKLIEHRYSFRSRFHVWVIWGLFFPFGIFISGALVYTSSTTEGILNKFFLVVGATILGFVSFGVCKALEELSEIYLEGKA